jgi:NAD(P)-dependent dehydrogenase (short-subunit alcohol dehydrogenase family)
MLLEDRTAIVYGGAGTIGAAVARAFAREGARVHLVGRTLDPLRRVADDIRAGGGTAEVAQVDAFDEVAVDEHADAVAAADGAIDIALNVISHGDVQGTPFVEMSVADYERPVITALRTTFITWRAVGRHMRRQGSGVILAFGGDGDPLPGWSLGGLQTAFSAIESMRRQVACELGPHGVRVVTLQTTGVVEAIPDDFTGRDEVVALTEGRSLMGRTATLDDVGNAAVFAASDWARTVTATQLNITCGSEVD